MSRKDRHPLKALPNRLPRPPEELQRLEAVWRTPQGWRYAQRRVIYDTSRVITLLATPI